MPDQQPSTHRPPRPLTDFVEAVTPLTPEQETKFRRWAQANGIADVNQPVPGLGLDLRAYWKTVIAKGGPIRANVQKGLAGAAQIDTRQPTMQRLPPMKAMDILGATGSATGRAMGSLMDKPGNLKDALFEGAKGAQAAVTGQGTTSPIAELDKRTGVETPWWAALPVDAMTDVGNILDPMQGLSVGAVTHGLPLIAATAEPLSQLVRRGLYSRIDDLLTKIGKEGLSPARLSKLVSKDSALAEEAAFRQVPQLIEAGGGKKVTQKTIPLSQVQAHLQAHPAPKPVVKTLGTEGLVGKDLKAWLGSRGVPQTPQEWTATSDELTRLAQQWQRKGDTAQANRYFTLSEQATEMAEGLDLGRGLGAEAPKYAQYQVPGGEAYRETLLTLPNQPHNPYESFVAQMEQKYGVGYDTDLLTPAERTQQSSLWERAQRGAGAMTESQFRSGHFDEPNIVVHTRANERTLPTGERGRFIEEVQSDWHQAGKKQGYATDERIQAALKAQMQAGTEHDALWKSIFDESQAQLDAAGSHRDPPMAIRAEMVGKRADYDRALAATEATQRDLSLARQGTPDAPFKKTWPKLGLKQQVLEAAADPTIEWIGHTTGATQAARYDLSKHLDELHYQPDRQRLIGFTKGGDKGIDEVVSPDKLADYIGKEGATKLLAQPVDTSSGHAAHVLRGADLTVGGEGMLMEYDQKLSADLQDILRPFGGTVEKPGPPAPVWNTRTQAWETPQGGLGGTVPTTAKKMDVDVPAFSVRDQNGHMRGVWENRADAEAYLRNPPDFIDPARSTIVPATTVRTTHVPTTEPAWMARLTPEMKREILEKGLPLSVLLGLIPLSQVGRYGQPPPESR